VILIGSDVLIEHLRGKTGARDWLLAARQSSGPLAISVVSLTEIAGGMPSPERREVMRLLGSMQRFEVTEQVAWRAATLMREYRRSHSGIGLGDALDPGGDVDCLAGPAQWGLLLQALMRGCPL
jgi:predicted nucleic acid-binding protein